MDMDMDTYREADYSQPYSESQTTLPYLPTYIPRWRDKERSDREMRDHVLYHVTHTWP
jgi:hypothetical protein